MIVKALFSRWWHNALDDPDIAREINNPQPGTYRVRLARGGPWVALCIWRERGKASDDWITRAVAGYGTPYYPTNGMELDVDRVWPYARAITYSEWRVLSVRNRADGDLAAIRVRVEAQP